MGRGGSSSPSTYVPTPVPVDASPPVPRNPSVLFLSLCASARRPPRLSAHLPRTPSLRAPSPRAVSARRPRRLLTRVCRSKFSSQTNYVTAKDTCVNWKKCRGVFLKLAVASMLIQSLIIIEDDDDLGELDHDGASPYP